MSKFASFYGLDYSSTFIFDESLNDNAKVIAISNNNNNF